jgi:hypothetical protein
MTDVGVMLCARHSLRASISMVIESGSEDIISICRVARSSEKSGKFLKFDHFSDFLLTF